MNKYRAAANGDLRNREIADSVLAEVVLIAESCSAVGVENLVGGGIIVVKDADFVFHDGVVALTNAADGPADGAGLGVICRRTLADVNVRIAGGVNTQIGSDNGSFAAEVELNMFAHGVVDNAVTCSDRNAARNGCESGGQLFRNIVGGSDCVEARCRVCCTSAKNVFTGRSGLKRN